MSYPLTLVVPLVLALIALLPGGTTGLLYPSVLLTLAALLGTTVFADRHLFGSLFGRWRASFVERRMRAALEKLRERIGLERCRITPECARLEGQFCGHEVALDLLASPRPARPDVARRTIEVRLRPLPQPATAGGGGGAGVAEGKTEEPPGAAVCRLGEYADGFLPILAERGRDVRCFLEEDGLRAELLPKAGPESIARCVGVLAEEAGRLPQALRLRAQDSADEGERRLCVTALLKLYPTHAATLAAFETWVAGPTGTEVLALAAEHLGPAAVPWLERVAASATLGAEVRASAAQQLGKLLLTGPVGARRAAILALARSRSATACERLQSLLPGADEETAAAVASALACVEEPRAEGLLVELLGHPLRKVRVAAIWSLRAVGSAAALGPLDRLCGVRSPGYDPGLAVAARTAMRAVRVRAAGPRAEGRLSLAAPGADTGALSLAQADGALTLAPQEEADASLPQAEVAASDVQPEVAAAAAALRADGRCH